jgi:HEAT repeat protein
MKGIRTAAVLLTLAVASTAGAQTPSIVEGRLDERRLTGSLEHEFTALMREGADASWIGYSVRGRDRSGGDGCWDGRNGRRTTPVKLEGSSDLFVLFRVENRAVGRVQIASPDCALDLGGLTLHWLTNVSATASLDWLSTFTRGDAPQKVASGAIVAIALHGDGAAVDRLLAIARDGKDRQTRSNALFWISQRAGDRAAGAITDAIDKDPDTEVKRQAVFALSQLPRNEAVPRLIDVARNNRNLEVRKRAMFWLGQSQDPRALAFFEDVLKSR